MTYKEISEALKDRKLDMVSAATSLHRDTIRAVRNMTGNPTESTLAKLRAYLGDGRQ